MTRTRFLALVVAAALTAACGQDAAPDAKADDTTDQVALQEGATGANRGKGQPARAG